MKLLLIGSILAISVFLFSCTPLRSTVPARSEDGRIGKANFPRYAELVEPDGFLNTENITIGEFIGKKVILIDFWTYSCINCQRTLPYITSWDEKYRDEGLLIIGVHTPEFGFEKKYENVKRAVEKFNIHYPVVQDNEYLTWRAYKNRYWPRKYLIDIDGYIVYDHIGEGAYEETEMRIQGLLKERADRLKTYSDMPGDISTFLSNVSFGQINTPEIYLGYQTTRGNNGFTISEDSGSFSLPADMKRNMVYVEGEWKGNAESLELVGDQGRVVLKYDSRDVHIVADGAGQKIRVLSPQANELIIDGAGLYTLVSGDAYGEDDLEFTIEGRGFQLFTFTFG